MRIHESWREELGWLMIMFGFAGFEYGLINRLALLQLPESHAASLLIMLVSLVVGIIGFSLHVTRPSKRDEMAKPEETKPMRDIPVQHA